MANTEIEYSFIVLYFYITDLNENIAYPSEVSFTFGLFIFLNTISLIKFEEKNKYLQTLFPFLKRMQINEYKP